jgi:cyclophilin family peptidyl-prolyl cis-trans isomerase/HEAT repeat protein
MRALRAVAALIWCGPLAARVAAQSPPQSKLQELLVAEDARGHGPDGVTPIVAGLQTDDTLMRRLAVRAAGHFQHPDFTVALYPRLRDSVPAIRGEAANAIAQITLANHAPDLVLGTVDLVGDSLIATLDRETDSAAANVEADAVGRFPYAGDDGRAATELVSLLASQRAYGAARGLYAMARRVGHSNPPLWATLTGPLAAAATDRRAAAPVRRLALLALIAGRAASPAVLTKALSDPDEQVRQIAVTGAAVTDSPTRDTLLRTGVRDRASIVRVAALATWPDRRRAVDCAPVIAALRDPVLYVRLSAIDALGAPCRDARTAVAALASIITRPRTGLSAHAWQEPAHALVALARTDSAAAAPFVADMSAATRWEERMYAARAADVTGDIAVLEHLAYDTDHNVVEAAIDGLHRRRGHAADSTYIAALTSDGHQAVRAAALALAGATDPRAGPALWRALARLTATRSENTRDPRMAILQTLAGTPVPGDSLLATAYVRDCDSTVAFAAAAITTAMTRRRVLATPTPLPITPEPLVSIMLLPTRPQLLVTLADSTGGGTFVITLLSDETPSTVARIVRLARAHYYDGHVFHRVEPDFVVQGGGPDASEYAGDRQFMRDELTSRTNARGTLGISTRGRDTGDAQWFINLVDNPRLDHDYTVFGMVTAGADAAGRIQEGDVIAHVVVQESVP